MFRNKKLPVFLLSFFSLSVSAATISNESMIGQPLDLIISGKPVKVNSCRDLAEATKGGGKVEKITSQLDRLTNQVAEETLLDCTIQAQLDKHGAKKISGKKLDLENTMNHLPANAIPSPSGPDKSLDKKTIYQAYPDLKISDGAGVTKKDAMMIRVKDRGIYQYKDGKTIHLIDVSMSVTDGTYATSSTYSVEENKHSIWKLSQINFNSTF